MNAEFWRGVTKKNINIQAGYTRIMQTSPTIIHLLNRRFRRTQGRRAAPKHGEGLWIPLAGFLDRLLRNPAWYLRRALKPNASDPKDLPWSPPGSQWRRGRGPTTQACWKGLCKRACSIYTPVYSCIVYLITIATSMMRPHTRGCAHDCFLTPERACLGGIVVNSPFPS